MQGKRLDRQTLTIGAVALVVLIVGALILGSADLFGTAGDKPTQEPPEVAQQPPTEPPSDEPGPAPQETEEPPTGERPPVGEQPPATEEPPAGDQPPVGEQPPATEEPPVGDQPPADEKPPATEAPIPEPTEAATEAPTEAPTEVVTEEATEEPTEEPGEQPAAIQAEPDATEEPEFGALDVTKIVDWSNVTPDTAQTFEICITGPTYPTGDCQSADYDGAVLSWADLEPGDYTVTETDPGADWTVSGSGVTVSVATNQTAGATVTNTYQQSGFFQPFAHEEGHPPSGTILVTKTVDWSGVTPDPSQTFEFCIFGPSFVSPPYDCQTVGPNGGTVMWDNLLPGRYDIVETEPGSLWIVDPSNRIRKGTIVDINIVELEFINTYNPGEPTLSVEGTCDIETGDVTFTLTNTGAPMSAGVPYTITNDDGTLESGTTNALGAGESQSFTVSAPISGGTVVFETTGTGGLYAYAEVEPCFEPQGPALTVEGTCDAATGQVTFTLTNTGAAMSAGVPYTITNDDGTLESGTTNALGAGESQSFTVSAPISGGTVVFETTGTGGLYAYAEVEPCFEPQGPALTVEGTCDIETGDVTFTLTNTGAPMSAGVPYTITNDDGPIASGTTNALGAGESQSFTVSAPISGGTVVFETTGTGGLYAYAEVEPCFEPEEPALTVEGTCDAATGQVTFTLTNTGAAMSAGVPYTITNDDGPIASGTTNALGTGESQVFTVPLQINGGTVVFETTGTGGLSARAEVDDCRSLPDLAAEGECITDTGVVRFTLTNLGDAMTAGVPYRIYTDARTLRTGVTNALGPNESQQFVVNARPNGATIYFIADGMEVPAETADCFALEKVSFDAQCTVDAVATFTITNNGGPMDQSATYEIVNENGDVVSSGSYQLGAGESTSATVTGHYGQISFNQAGAKQVTTYCAPPPPPQTPPPPPTEEPEEPTEEPPQPPAPVAVAQGICGETTETGANGFPVISMNPEDCLDEPLPAPEWEPLEVGEAVCPDWFVYHTNMTGDWEVFRLGELPDNPGAEPNLTQGVGPRIYDVAPSRSPDAEWITFASNRDGNWEIYIGRADGTEQRRVTYNTTAIEIDPMWSPDGEWIVYDSARDGRWELYMINVVSGVEVRLTDDPGNDLNAFWSPDGTKLVFQSDRDGLWQIYELVIATKEVTLLSDGEGDDHDPQYSFDGEQVAFRSYRNGENSVVYTMDADGANVQAVSDLAADATNHAWSDDDSLIAYQSDLDGDLDIYVFEVETGQTRQVTDNDIPDYAPTWWCQSPVLIFTSDITGDSNIFDTPALPMDADPIDVMREAGQLTTDEESDQYPENSPTEENASRQQSLPSPAKNR